MKERAHVCGKAAGFGPWHPLARSARVRLGLIKDDRAVHKPDTCGLGVREDVAATASAAGEATSGCGPGPIGSRPGGSRGRGSGPAEPEQRPRDAAARCAPGGGGGGGRPRPRAQDRRGSRRPANEGHASGGLAGGTYVRKTTPTVGRNAPMTLRSSRAAHDPSDDHTSSLVRIRSRTASVNSVVPAWPPRSGVLVPAAIVSNVPS